MMIFNFILKAILKDPKKYEEIGMVSKIIIGITSFLLSSIMTVIVAEVIDEYLATINNVGFNKVTIVLGVILGLLGAAIWYFGCVAARCHSLLYVKWFK